MRSGVASRRLRSVRVPFRASWKPTHSRLSRPPFSFAAPLLAARPALAGRWGLIIALAGAARLSTAFTTSSPAIPGSRTATRRVSHDLTYLGNNLVQGISNGTIWALIAIGYTLVYGIIELINFAHGDVFMIGSFTGAGFWASIGLGLTTGPLGLVLGLLRDADRLRC